MQKPYTFDWDFDQRAPIILQNLRAAGGNFDCDEDLDNAIDGVMGGREQCGDRSPDFWEPNRDAIRRLIAKKASKRPD